MELTKRKFEWKKKQMIQTTFDATACCVTYTHTQLIRQLFLYRSISTACSNSPADKSKLLHKHHYYPQRSEGTQCENEWWFSFSIAEMKSLIVSKSSFEMKRKRKNLVWLFIFDHHIAAHATRKDAILISLRNSLRHDSNIDGNQSKRSKSWKTLDCMETMRASIGYWNSMITDGTHTHTNSNIRNSRTANFVFLIWHQTLGQAHTTRVCSVLHTNCVHILHIEFRSSE